MSEWPALSFDDWESTCDTLHLWTQIVGKTRLALTPLENHWWNVPLYVTSCGLTTSAIPFDGGVFEAEFDFLQHKLALRNSAGAETAIGLYPRSVADFYREYMAKLASLGIEVHIYQTPSEFDDTTPFDQDEHHASYDQQSVEKFQRILIGADRVFKQFRSRFIGKCSPVHFFWGSFDLAVTRFSGRPAIVPEGADPITREAYSHEVISCGFWPGDRRFRHASFYSYTAPSPPGLKEKVIRPDAAHWDTQLGEFILKYDDARASASPERAILEFCQSTYEAGAECAAWDRDALERH
jgi:Family of unknown function (DUF5996)